MSIRVTCFLLLLPAVGHAQPSVSADLAGLGAVRIESVRVAEVSPRGISISVELSLTPARTIAIESIRLSSLRMNGLPVFTSPLTSPMQLTVGKPATIPPLVVKVLFRDLNSVAPLRKMLEEGTVHLQGQAQAVVRIGFLERLALHTERPIISVPINQDVPVSIAGPALAGKAALAALTLVESTFATAAAAGKHLPGLEPAWIEALEAKAPGALVEVETNYALTENKAQYSVLFDQLGFRLDGALLVTTPESRAPWEYDPEFLGRIHSKEARLDPNTVDIQVIPLTPDPDTPATLQLSDGGFTLQERGSPDEDRMLVSAKGVVSVKVRRRASLDALLLLAPTRSAPNRAFSPAPDDILHQDHWEKLAVFRLVSSTSGTKAAKPVVELIQLSGHREGKFIRFEDPLDSAAFGSPILTPEGILGIVQDETTGTFLPPDLRHTPVPQ